MELHLRYACESDRLLLHAWRNQEHIRAVSLNSQIIESETHDKWFDSILRGGFRTPLICSWNSRPAGVIQIENWDPLQKVGMWGCYVGDVNASPLLGAALPFLAIDHAFESLGARKLQAVVLASNLRMLQIHKRLGIRQEGRFISQTLSGSDEIDQIMFGIHRNEWPEFREKTLLLFPISLRQQLMETRKIDLNGKD